MNVTWKIKEGEEPVIFRRAAKWNGVKVSHWRVLAGDLDEYTTASHEITIPINGTIATRKHNSVGKNQMFYGGNNGICLCLAGQPFAASWQTEIECLSISLAPSLMSQIIEKSPNQVELYENHYIRDPLIQNIGFALLNEMKNDGEARCNSSRSEQSAVTNLYAESLAQTLSLHLVKNYSNVNVQPSKFNTTLSGYKLRRVKEFINEHLEDEITLLKLAETVNLSQFHFLRAFKTATGATPQQFLTHQRIERAKQLIAESDLPLIEISARVGFKNQSHFTTLFRKFTSMTPKAWREIIAN